MPIDDARVLSELTRYLSDNWAPIYADRCVRYDVKQSRIRELHKTAGRPAVHAVARIGPVIACSEGAPSRV